MAPNKLYLGRLELNMFFVSVLLSNDAVSVETT
jgi:hypothetical protein